MSVLALVLLTTTAVGVPAGGPDLTPGFAPEGGGTDAPVPALFAPFEDREAMRPLPDPPELSKKAAWLADKARRLDVHMTDRDLSREQREKRFPRRASVALKGVGAGEETGVGGTPTGSRVAPLTTLFNLHTREALPLVPGHGIGERFHKFLRDYTTNQATQMDARLIGVLERVALRFSPSRIEVVSGYRSPKYNLMLRKKGREVAKSSQHSGGQAVDFRVRGVPTRRLLNFVKSLRLGGVGYYPRSEFVHCDSGRIRFWRGT
jgi:hypothetical protein